MSCANTINKLSYETCKLINNKNDIAAQLRLTNFINIANFDSDPKNLVYLEVEFPKIKTNNPLFKEFIVILTCIDIQNALGLVFSIAEINSDPTSEFIKYNFSFEINIPTLFDNIKKIINLINKKKSTIFWTELTKFFVSFSGNNIKSLNSLKIPLFEEVITGTKSLDINLFDNKINISKEKINEIYQKFNELKNKN
jgi:hypothetical protein